MKKITYIIILLLTINFGYGQTKIAEITFETAGGYTTSIVEFTDDAASTGEDYFIRTDGSNIGGEAFTNIQGTNYFAAQDIDGEGATLPATFLMNDVNISGYSSLEIRVHLAEDDDGASQDWDNSDYVHFDFDIDNTATFSNLLWLENDGSTFNSAPFIDTDFDGTGDGTEITDTFTQFTQTIAGTGSLLDIQIEFFLNAGDEDIAIDNIEIWGILAPCATTTTWAAGAWDNGVPVIGVNAVIDDAYDTSNGGFETSFSACSLTITASGDLIIANSTFIEVENNVTVDGTITVQTQGNFVQNDNAGTFTVNASGSSVVNKLTAVKQDWFYYTYWSSPVNGETIAGAFPNTDADRRYYFNAANYLDADGDEVDDNDDDWQVALGTDVMTPGVGYAAMSGRLGLYPSQDNASFSGPFNTGDISTSISYNVLNITGSWNFIGNPYPSAIDFNAFETANSSVIDGAAYFWSQSLPPDGSNPGNQVNNFNQNDYATYTVGSGGVAGASGVIPTQYIPSGQSFFIAGLANGNVTFTNAIRMADGTSNAQFFKNSNNNSKSNKSNSVSDKLWVNLTSDNGVFNQILVAYVEGASVNDDGLSYDAPKFLSNEYAILYSIIENSNKIYVIQGKSPSNLTENEIINLGFKTSIGVETLYTLSIAQLQGEFLNSNTVYLKDNLLNEIHNLSDSDYAFTSEVGEFNDRFQIVFNSALLSTDDITLDDNHLTIIELENNQVQFKTSNNSIIKTISIYDMLGRQLYHLKGQNSTETYTLSNLSNTIFIAKVELENGTVITKKAIKK